MRPHNLPGNAVIVDTNWSLPPGDYLPVPRVSHELTGKIREQIAGLGGNSEAIAAMLAIEGVKGEKGEANNCAIAQYVQRHFADDIGEVDVASKVNIYYEVDDRWEWDSFELPDAVQRFIIDFDAGNYPGLVE